MSEEKRTTNESGDRLTAARTAINEIDREMADLFVRRMAAVREVAAYKGERGMPIFDPAREEALLARNSSLIADDELRGYYTDFLRSEMRISRDFQRKMLSGMRVAFSGVVGAFASIAAGRIFPHATRVPCQDFKAAYDAVVSGDCDVAVLPIENSTAGEVGSVMDMLFSGPLFINGVYDLSITHHLLGVAGARASEVREVISHPQALAQCAPYIRRMGYAMREFENTALAAQYVAEKMDPTVAAIASEETAALYGLSVLEKNINSSGMNTTRFAVLSRALSSDVGGHGKHSILMFTARNEAGALASAINIIGRHGYNMRCLRSRPMKELLWQYYFYAELEGDLDSPAGKEMLSQLATTCDRIKMLGTFRYPAELHADFDKEETK